MEDKKQLVIGTAVFFGVCAMVGCFAEQPYGPMSVIVASLFSVGLVILVVNSFTPEAADNAELVKLRALDRDYKQNLQDIETLKVDKARLEAEKTTVQSSHDWYKDAYEKARDRVTALEGDLKEAWQKEAKAKGDADATLRELEQVRKERESARSSETKARNAVLPNP